MKYSPHKRTAIVTEEYRQLSEKDLNSCLELWVHRMAQGYQSRIMLTNVAEGVDGYAGVIAEIDGELVGFAAGHLGTFGELLAVPYPRVETIDGLEATQTVGNLAVVCVDESHGNHGIGTELVSRIIEELRGYDVPIVTQTWERGSVDGGDVVGKLGFEAVLTLNDYWCYTTTDCAPCPECGESPCDCPGTLFVSDP